MVIHSAAGRGGRAETRNAREELHSDANRGRGRRPGVTVWLEGARRAKSSSSSLRRLQSCAQGIVLRPTLPGGDLVQHGRVLQLRLLPLRPTHDVEHARRRRARESDHRHRAAFRLRLQSARQGHALHSGAVSCRARFDANLGEQHARVLRRARRLGGGRRLELWLVRDALALARLLRRRLRACASVSGRHPTGSTPQRSKLCEAADRLRQRGAR